MAQPGFAGRDGGGGAAHVAQDQAGEQREAGERDRDEGNDAVDDLGARLLRRPGEPGDRSRRARRSDRRRNRRRRPAALSTLRRLRNCRRDAISASTSSSMNFTLSTNGACSSADWVLSSGEMTATAATMAGRPRNACKQHGAVQARFPVASPAGAGRVRARRSMTGVTSGRIVLNQFGSTLRWPSERIDQAVGGVRHEHEVMVEIGLQPTADPALHPVGIEFGADAPGRAPEVATLSISRSTRSP